MQRRSASTPDSDAPKDADIKTLKNMLERAESERKVLDEIARDLVKKNNHDNDVLYDHVFTLKQSVVNTNNKLGMMRILAKDNELLGFLIVEEVPESSEKILRLDEGTYIDNKIAARRPSSQRTGNLHTLLKAALSDEEESA